MQLRRKLRHDISVWGRYRNGRGIAMEVQIYDLSEHGCRFRQGWARLETQDFITLTIGSIGPINAHVVWTKSTMVGVQFDQQLHPSVLNHIVTQMDERPELGS